MKSDLDKITEIIRDLFDEYEGAVTPALSARDVDQWDSLANVQFIVMVEKSFGVRFRTEEIGRFGNIGDVLAAVDALRKAQG